MENVEELAYKFLKDAYGQDAEFRSGQLEAIKSVIEKKKTLVVQKTGWGKSLVYFIATKILRMNGAGPTIIVSPLLALMDNQVDASKILGITTVTINSENVDMWDELYANLSNYDAIIVSPERLSNEKFMSSLSKVEGIELFVVDEAHSISDWGHDFRPDYQRIVKLLGFFPKNISVLGTTATANDRVIEDVKAQLGNDLVVVKGDLIRENISIQVNPKQSREERLAWILQNLKYNELFEGQGIIYCLTQSDCDKVAMFLKNNGVSAEAYHSGLGKNSNNVEIAKLRLQKYDKGEIKVLVSTIKLGMGYDKSDIRFIIHYQMPQNLVSYYQQIGRSGRDGDPSIAILLHGDEDNDILGYFIEGAQSKPELLSEIIKFTKDGATIKTLLDKINIRDTKIREALKYLEIHSYIFKERSQYFTNPIVKFEGEKELKKRKIINQIRRDELDNLCNFMSIDKCFMRYIANELDAPDLNDDCGKCKNCCGNYLVPLDIDANILNIAIDFLSKDNGVILPRKLWANNSRIAPNELCKPGLVLSESYFTEVGKAVKKGKYSDNCFSDYLVKESSQILNQFVKNNKIDLIVPVPSLRRPHLVSDFARKLGIELNIEVLEVLIKTKNSVEQKRLLNSIKQSENILNSTEVLDDKRLIKKRILLVDDMVDSRWTFTVIASKLVKAGADSVYPFAIVRTGSG